MISPCHSDSGQAGQSPGEFGRNRRPLRVLLVDDHLLMRCRTRQQLEEIPFIQVIAEATDGFEAVALARTLSPELIFMDISMPGLDGIEATRRIIAELPQIRVIMLSSYEGKTFQENAQEAGAHAYVVKGESTELIAKAIEWVCGRR
jgi:NarL family two-component system response regulator LiaR